MHTNPVIFLLNALNVGGSETKTVHLVNSLFHRGWPVHLLYLNPPDTLIGKLDPAVPVQCLERRGKISLRAVLRLYEYAKRHNVRTIVATNLYPSIYSSAAKCLLQSGQVRNFVTVNTTDHVGLKDKVQMIVYAPVLRRADHVVFGCEAQMNQWIASYRLRAGNGSVIYNGVDLVRFRPGSSHDASQHLREKLGYSADDIIVGTVGQLRPEKGHADLIEVLSQLLKDVPNAKGLFVGDGPERDALKTSIEAVGMADRITLLGEVQDVRPALELMDIFVLPSVAVETFSNAALEAMAFGKPVILSDIGGAREMIADGYSGRIFPRRDMGSLSKILLELARDPFKRRTLGCNARQSVEDRFSYAKMVEAFEHLLEGDRQFAESSSQRWI
jgi:glycosyltransferase involved in cell wall biosynthesis